MKTRDDVLFSLETGTREHENDKPAKARRFFGAPNRNGQFN
jgi:hypothetical protein